MTPYKIHKTTLGAPISPEEYGQIMEVVQDVWDFAEAIPLDMRPDYYLGMATGLIDKGFKLRDTVQKVFNDANRRHLALTGKAAVGGPRKSPLSNLSLDVSDMAIEEVLEALKGVQK